MSIKYVLFITSLFLSALLYSQPDTCLTKECVETCTVVPNNEASITKNLVLVSVLILGIITLYASNKKKSILVGGGALIFLILATAFFLPLKNNCNLSESILLDTNEVKEDIFEPAGKEFINTNDEFDEISTDEFESVDNNEFMPVGDSFPEKIDDEFSKPGDEFSSFQEENETTDDEFISIETDEFTNVEENFLKQDKNTLTETGNISSIDKKDSKLSKSEIKLLYKLLIIGLLIVFISLFLNKGWFIKLRPFFMLSIIIWLGFIGGACPCMISSFQNTFLGIMGAEVSWVSMLWFLGLLPLTYLFGKVWCGWLCHLGGLQEFLFGATKLEILKSPKSQKLIKGLQIVTLITLIVQLIVTQSNIFIHYDPFKVAFNLFSANTTGYVLLVIMLVSSVLIYRPFCRGLCPVGLMLGWVALIPGAKKIKQDESCKDCIKCSKACKAHAITYRKKTSEINKENCIACGECLNSCKTGSLLFSNKH